MRKKKRRPENTMPPLTKLATSTPMKPKTQITHDANNGLA